MADKTEDQIQREKEAVAKMVGAKSAMEAALQRIATLEEYGARMARLAHELGRFASQEALIRTNYHRDTAMGGYHSDASTASAKSLLRQVDHIKTEIFEKA